MSKTRNGRPARRASRRKRKAGLLPDVHLPRHNPAAVRWAVRGLRDEGLTHLYLLGDVVTFDSVSRFKKTLQTASSLPDEFKQGRQFIRWIEKQLPGVKVTYLFGNHEDRPYSNLLKNAPEWSDLPELELRRLLGIPAGWKVVPYGDYIMEQGVVVQHGKRWGRATCRQNLEFGCSSVQGHSHRVNSAQRRLADGRQIVAVELGCLCDFDQGYSKLNDWTHAVGWIEGGHIIVKTRDGHGKR